MPLCKGALSDCSTDLFNRLVPIAFAALRFLRARMCSGFDGESAALLLSACDQHTMLAADRNSFLLTPWVIHPPSTAKRTGKVDQRKAMRSNLRIRRDSTAPMVSACLHRIEPVVPPVPEGCDELLTESARSATFSRSSRARSRAGRRSSRLQMSKWNSSCPVQSATLASCALAALAVPERSIGLFARAPMRSQLKCAPNWRGS
jgi:hypothetical protein